MIQFTCNELVTINVFTLLYQPGMTSKAQWTAFSQNSFTALPLFGIKVEGQSNSRWFLIYESSDSLISYELSYECTNASSVMCHRSSSYRHNMTQNSIHRVQPPPVARKVAHPQRVTWSMRSRDHSIRHFLPVVHCNRPSISKRFKILEPKTLTNEVTHSYSLTNLLTNTADCNTSWLR